ncbi:MAG: hypothetical protein JSW08_00925 [archaeon]|nr:MAG: hypothetical protein JSW08_00925 [archaeon]
MKKAGIFLLIGIIFVIILTVNVSSVPAPVCCEKDNAGRYCVETTDDLCAPGARKQSFPSFLETDCSKVSFCQLGACVPREGQCELGKYKAECEVYGRHVARVTDLQEVPACKLGGCSVNCQAEQYKICEELAAGNEFEFTECECKEGESYTSCRARCQTETYANCRSKSKGCCKVSDGCYYVNFEQCADMGGTVEDFFKGVQCSEVVGCDNVGEQRISCGQYELGDENKICLYDNRGQQERCAPESGLGINFTNGLGDEINYNSCNFAEGYICKICKEESCNLLSDDDTSDEVAKTYPYCKQVSCNNIDLEGSQEIEVIDAKFWGFETNKRIVTKVNDEPFSLRHGEQKCYNYYGSFERGEGKEDIARMGDRSTGLQNQYLECEEGELKVFGMGLDRNTLCQPAVSESGYGYAKEKANVWQNCTSCGRQNSLVIEWIGDVFRPFWPTGYLLSISLGSLISDRCNRDTCMEAGDCMYVVDWHGVFPGTEYGNCVPVYPPGVTNWEAGKCGEGGDDLWNVCDAGECYSLGNYQFQKNFWLSAGTGVLTFYPTTVLERLNLIPVECAVQALHSTAIPGGYLAEYGRCFTKKYSKYGPLTLEFMWKASPLALVDLIGYIDNPFYSKNPRYGNRQKEEEQTEEKKERSDPCSSDGDCKSGQCRTTVVNRVDQDVCVELNSVSRGDSCISIKGPADSECREGLRCVHPPNTMWGECIT